MKNLDELKYIKATSEILDKVTEDLDNQNKRIKTNRKIIIILCVVNIILLLLIILLFIGVL